MMETEGSNYARKEILVVTLDASTFYSKSINFQKSLLACFGYRVLSVDVCDTIPQPVSFQGNWIVISQTLGNSASFSYRYESTTLSNVIKVFSRLVTISGNVFEHGNMNLIDVRNFTDMDFSVRNYDGSPIITNPTTTIQITIEFLLCKVF